MTKAWILIVMLSLCLMGCTTMKHGHSESGEQDEIKFAFDQLPPAVKAGFNTAAPGAIIKDVDKETEDGKTVYEADVIIDGRNWEIKVAESGAVVSKKLDNEAGENQNGQHEDKDDHKMGGQRERNRD